MEVLAATLDDLLDSDPALEAAWRECVAAHREGEEPQATARQRRELHSVIRKAAQTGR
jgi:hypothetical protein